MDRKEAPDPEYDDHDITIPSIEKSMKTIELQANEGDRAAMAPEMSAPPYQTNAPTAASVVSSGSYHGHYRPAPTHAPSMSPSEMSSPSTIARRPVPGAESRTSFACLSMHMTDRIRLMRFPAHMVPQIIEMVRTSWPKGINAPREYGQSLEIKLNGNPWSPHSWGESKVDARRLVTRLLDGLYLRGWIIKASVDIGHVGPDVENCQVKGTMFEIKLHGNPWRAVGTKTVQTRVILLAVMDVLEQQGFSLYATINHNSRRSKDSSTAEADTWYCNRRLDWKPGEFVYHG
ncbi:hypothetical protein MferCBS49748_001489 [Microsporum ferrugineum]